MAAAGFRRAILAASAIVLASGCAMAPVGARTIEGEWRVVAIDGKATPANPDQFMMRFEQGNASARFGCNSIGGDYTLAGATLTVISPISTMMACPGQPADFEREGKAVLNQPMAVAWSDARHVNLSNSAGTIALER